MFSSRLHNHLYALPLRWSLCAPVALALGIVVYFCLPNMPALVTVIVVALVMMIAAVTLWRTEALRPMAMGLLLAAAGFALAHYQTAERGTPMLKYDAGVRDVTGRIINVEPQDNYVRVYLDDVSIERLPVAITPYKVRFSYRLAEPLPPIGTRVTCAANVKAIASAVLPQGYNFREHYYYQRIGATGFVVAPCAALTEPKQNSLAVITAAARNSLSAIIHGDLTGDEAAITEALLTGVQQGISDETMTAMRVSGLVHILSPSGLHIGLAAGILFFVLRALLALFPYIALRYPIKKWAAGAALLSAWGYTYFVGAPVPAVRSCLMITLALVAVMLDRQALTLRTIAMAACVILLLYPASVLSPSFQLSFAAVTSIIAAVEATEAQRRDLLADRGFIMRAVFYVMGSAAVALVASFATLPFTYYHFQQVNLYGVFANMLADPLAAFWLMPLAVLVFMLVPLGLAKYPLLLLGKGVSWLIAIADGVAAMPGSDWIVPALPYVAFVLMIIGLLWLVVWNGRVRWAAATFFVLAIPFMVFSERPQALVDGQGKFVAFRDGDGYTLMATGKVRDDNFVLQQWQRYLGVRSFAAADENERCDSAGCFDGQVDYLRDPAALTDACGRGVPYVLLSADSPARCKALIDLHDLRWNGAHSIGADGRVDSVAAATGGWPWRD